MDIKEAIYARHSVRKYIDKPIENETIEILNDYISQCNDESGLHFQLITNEPKAFDSKMAHYGNFENVHNYIAIIGKKSKNLEELCGYYGQKVVLFAQTLGLNTCWVALSYQKVEDKYSILDGEKLVLVIAIGYGENNGKPHNSKPLKQLCDMKDDDPQWYKDGVECALLAPTALNQQYFYIKRDGNSVSIKNKFGILTKLDLGIVKYNFEIGAGKENFIWK